MEIDFDYHKQQFLDQGERFTSHELCNRRQFVDGRIADLFSLVESDKVTILGSGVPFILGHKLPVEYFTLIDSRQWVGEELRDHLLPMMAYNSIFPKVRFFKRDMNWADDLLDLSAGTTLIIPASEYLVNDKEVINPDQEVIIVNECSGEVFVPRKVSCFYYIDEMKERFNLSEYYHTSKERFQNREYIFMVGRK